MMDHEQFKGIVIVSEGAKTLLKGLGREVDITPLMNENLLVTGGRQVGKMTSTLITQKIRNLLEDTLKSLEESPKSGVRVCVFPDYHSPSYFSDMMMRDVVFRDICWCNPDPLKSDLYREPDIFVPGFLDFDKHNHSKFKFDSQGDVNSSVPWEQQVKRRQKSIRAKAARKQNRRN